MISSHRSILGTRIDATSYSDACDRIQYWVENHLYCYVVAANVHVVMTGYWHSAYRRIINGASLVTPDGMPLVWGVRLLGMTHQNRVYGPDLMLSWCDRAASLQIPVYLYGGKEKTLVRLRENLQELFPNLIIAGSYSPPFRPLTSQEEEEDRKRIHATGAKVVFVSLGCPKQEEWMARQQGKLNAVAIGVGAAFSFHGGEISQAPRWMMKFGLEWIYRLTREPKRLWQRYLINNPSFLFLFGLQFLRVKLGSKGYRYTKSQDSW
jgi:N-acetylglucosaminyldiphosphoundecaprenol N-acetyl-beta-D-mannosaminyltransferase